MPPNRVAGRIDLLAPTPPDLRVGVQRFLTVPGENGMEDAEYSPSGD